MEDNKLITLKEQLKEGNAPNQLYIFVYEDNRFLADEYTSYLANSKHKTIQYVNSLNELSSNSLWGDIIDEDTLYVYSLDTLEEDVDITLNNLVIITHEVKDTLLSKLDRYIFNFPKLENWWVYEWAKVRAKGLNENIVNWLCLATNYDVFRLNNELDKINIFQEDKQEQMFMLIDEEKGYNDLNQSTIFNLTNAIMKRNKKEVNNILKGDTSNIEPLGVVAVLIKSFKNLINIQMSNNPTPESTGMKPQQFNAYKYMLNTFTNMQLVNKYKELLLIDSKLKSGLLPQDKILNYVIGKVM